MPSERTLIELRALAQSLREMSAESAASAARDQAAGLAAGLDRVQARQQGAFERGHASAFEIAAYAIERAIAEDATRDMLAASLAEIAP